MLDTMEETSTWDLLHLLLVLVMDVIAISFVVDPLNCYFWTAWLNFDKEKHGTLSRFRYIDMAESLCQKRALEAFRLDPAKWGGKYVTFVWR